VAHASLKPFCEWAEKALERDYRSAIALARANAQRQAQVHTGIHRAADRFLPPLIMRGELRGGLTGALRKYLQRRYALFGLERWPCRRVVHEALKKWTPPSGGARDAR
jgi:hypothetical protein